MSVWALSKHLQVTLLSLCIAIPSWRMNEKQKQKISFIIATFHLSVRVCEADIRAKNLFLVFNISNTQKEKSECQDQLAHRYSIRCALMYHVGGVCPLCYKMTQPKD